MREITLSTEDQKWLVERLAICIATAIVRKAAGISTFSSTEPYVRMYNELFEADVDTSAAEQLSMLAHDEATDPKATLSANEAFMQRLCAQARTTSLRRVQISEENAKTLICECVDICSEAKQRAKQDSPYDIDKYALETEWKPASMTANRIFSLLTGLELR